MPRDQYDYIGQWYGLVCPNIIGAQLGLPWQHVVFAGRQHRIQGTIRHKAKYDRMREFEPT